MHDRSLRLVWLVYDISSDRVRTRLAARCQAAGLERVQQSVWMGMVDPSRLDELLLECEAQVDPSTDSVYAFPFRRSEFDAARVVGAALDRVRILNEEILRWR